jgi:DNA-binding transcriptional LysR family regulator
MGQIDLNAARVLVRVAQAGSFRGAAKALGLPKTTVSRRVAELEAHLGAQLLRRTTRSLALTDAGAAFVEQAEPAIARLESAEQAVSALGREPRGRLRVTATVNAGQALLAPVLADFLLAYPAVEVVLHLTDRYVDLVAERFDVALRTGTLADSSLVAHRIAGSSYSVVASPHYLEANGTPKTPAELADHACLLFAKSGTPARASWPFVSAKRTREVKVAGRLVADDFVVLREAAIRGVGIARLPAIYVRDALRRGALTSILDEHAPPQVPLQLVSFGGRHLPPHTRAFIDFVRPRIAEQVAGTAQEGRGQPQRKRRARAVT